tara:strand:- start:1122 stop:1748 length:627 start_codon:yes stop_codon:yes gene_type:complete
LKLNLKPIFEVISVLKEYLIPHKKIKSKFQNLENLDDIKIFIQERSALVSQTTLYGYLKTRMGLKYTLMFTDKIFLESVDKAKWNIYISALSDCTLFAYSYLISNKKIDLASAKETYFEILEKERVNGLPENLIVDSKNIFEQRLKEVDWYTYSEENPFKLSGLALYKWSPIADELKELDKEIVLNSIKNKWNLVVEEFKKRTINFKI